MSTSAPPLSDVGTDSVLRLRSFAKEHDVCFEVWPEYLPIDGRKAKVGLEIDLCGTVIAAEPHFCAACPLCEQTYADLKEIAVWALEQWAGSLEGEILAFDHALHMGRGARHRPEVVVALHFANPHARSPISDPEQAGCLARLRKKLAEIGIAER